MHPAATILAPFFQAGHGLSGAPLVSNLLAGWPTSRAGDYHARMTDLADIVSSAFWRVNPPDADPVETREWLEAFDALVETEGRERATFLLRKLLDHARARRVPLPPVLNTPYKNSVALAEQPQFPGNLELESRLSAIVRWNALAMVVRANRAHPELGGHIASYASAADLFEVGFNHFFRADDLVYFQPHSAPGVYARAFLEGRLSEEHLANYRRETGGKGLSSYCHPYLMPEFWQFPTGSMGLGPLNAIYQARFMRYLEHRSILEDAETQGLGVRRRRRDGRARIARRPVARRARGARQPDLRRQLQPAAPRRPGARQRLDRAGARRPVRRRGLERDQAAVGLGLGSAVRARPRRRAAQAPARDGRRRVPDLRRDRRPLQPRAFLQQVSRAARADRRHERRGHRPPAPRRPRSGEDLRRLPRGLAPQGPADGDPRQDQEGLRHGPLGPGQDGHPPAEEARRRGAARVPRPLRAAALRRGRRAAALLPPGGRRAPRSSI